MKRFIFLIFILQSATALAAEFSNQPSYETQSIFQNTTISMQPDYNIHNVEETSIFPEVTNPVPSETPLDDDYVWDTWTCSVLRHGPEGNGTLPDLIDRFNSSSFCRDNIIFSYLNPPLRVVLQDPMSIQGAGLLLTGADVDHAGAYPLEVIIDGRAVRNSPCLITINYPDDNVVRSLTLYVWNDPNKAVCNSQGESLISLSSPAYDSRYRNIRVCRGERANECFEAPITYRIPVVSHPVSPIPVGAGGEIRSGETIGPTGSGGSAGSGESAEVEDFSGSGGTNGSGGNSGTGDRAGSEGTGSFAGSSREGIDVSGASGGASVAGSSQNERQDRTSMGDSWGCQLIQYERNSVHKLMSGTRTSD